VDRGNRSLSNSLWPLGKGALVREGPLLRRSVGGRSGLLLSKFSKSEELRTREPPAYSTPRRLSRASGSCRADSLASGHGIILRSLPQCGACKGARDSGPRRVSRSQQAPGRRGEPGPRWP